jgi:hypothetical protein
MSQHKFGLGHSVILNQRSPGAALGEYEVVRLLPPEGAELLYRIKSKREAHERVAREDQLTSAHTASGKPAWGP